MQVIEPSYGGGNRAETVRGPIVCENGILVAILLVDEVDGDGRGLGSLFRGCSGRDEGVVLPEVYVLFAERDCPSCALGDCIFANPQEEEEGQGEEVRHGREAGVLGPCCNLWEELEAVNWGGNLLGGARILLLVLVQLAREDRCQTRVSWVVAAWIYIAGGDHG
jgi:hypothetical protein